MADQVRFRWKNGSFYHLRNTPQVVGALEAIGRRITDEANAALPPADPRKSRKPDPGYMMSSRQGRRNPQGRWHVRVFTASNHAKAEEARNNHLNRILGGEG